MSFDRNANEFAHDVVCIAKGNVLSHEIVCKIGRRSEPLERSVAHGRSIGLDMGKHVDKSTQTVLQGFDGVKERFFIFLVVFVVGERLALHERQ